nr:hypothetical protein [Tanacetum cinerariifolium]
GCVAKDDSQGGGGVDGGCGGGLESGGGDDYDDIDGRAGKVDEAGVAVVGRL